MVGKTACRFVCKSALTKIPESFEFSGLFITWGVHSKVGFISLPLGLWSFSTFLEACMLFFVCVWNNHNIFSEEIPRLKHRKVYEENYMVLNVSLESEEKNS